MVVIGQQQWLLDAGQNWIPKQVPTRGAFVSKLVAHHDRQKPRPWWRKPAHVVQSMLFPFTEQIVHHS